jgi:hypothetical protein
MTSTQAQSGPGAKPDLSLLEQMVGIRKGLHVMVAKGVPPTREMVLALMETEKEVYASEGMFKRKNQALGKIIAGFEQGTYSVDDILRGAGIDPNTIQRSESSSVLKRLWRKIMPG